MRVRLIRPTYWSDADLHTRLTADVREFYIGLWMESDDAGYVTWDVDRLGADLYPFRSLAWRRQRLPKWLEQLGSHVRMLDCGKHVVVPNLARHQTPPRPSYQNQRAHDKCLMRVVPPGASREQVAAAQVGGSTGVVLEGGRSATDETEFDRAMAAAGSVHVKGSKR